MDLAVFLPGFSVQISFTCCLQGGGVHGNALLTKFDVLDAAVMPHRQAGRVKHVPTGSLVHIRGQLGQADLGTLSEHHSWWPLLLPAARWQPACSAVPAGQLAGSSRSGVSGAWPACGWRRFSSATAAACRLRTAAVRLSCWAVALRYTVKPS